MACRVARDETVKTVVLLTKRASFPAGNGALILFLVDHVARGVVLFSSA